MGGYVVDPLDQITIFINCIVFYDTDMITYCCFIMIWCGGGFGDYEVANVERFVGRGGGRSVGGACAKGGEDGLVVGLGPNAILVECEMVVRYVNGWCWNNM